VKRYGRAGYTDDNIIWRMRFSLYITKATNAHSEHIILFSPSTATLVLWTCLNVTLYVLSLSCDCLLMKTHFILVIRKDITLDGHCVVLSVCSLIHTNFALKISQVCWLRHHEVRCDKTFSSIRYLCHTLHGTSNKSEWKKSPLMTRYKQSIEIGGMLKDRNFLLSCSTESKSRIFLFISLQGKPNNCVRPVD
jgi:hypothetical protein